MGRRGTQVTVIPDMVILDMVIPAVTIPAMVAFSVAIKQVKLIRKCQLRELTLSILRVSKHSDGGCIF